jgi:hypothetical protein
MSPTSLTDLARGLDAPSLPNRLEALRALCACHARDDAALPPEARGPCLPSYDHVHSRYSYGSWVPGVCSVAHQVWAAHVNRAPSITAIEHESLAHYEEAMAAVRIVNDFRGASPLPLLLGIEFKARIDARCVPGPAGDLFRRLMLRQWGQDQAAWVIGVGATVTPEIRQLVARFQSVKRQRAAWQLDLLNAHLDLTPPLRLEDLLTDEGNITDRLLCFAVASRLVSPLHSFTPHSIAAQVRRLLNPGQAAGCDYPDDHPGFLELMRVLQNNGLVPFFSAQIRGDDLRTVWPHLEQWGVRGLDTGGIEPDEPDAQAKIQTMLDLAEQRDLFLIGGVDYRGAGTGWTRHQAWMDHPRIVQTRRKLAWNP